MIRDQEIQRLVKYAAGMGCRVIFSNNKKVKNSAEWALDGSTIFIYTANQRSKTDTVLSLLHEICHNLDFIHRVDRGTDHKVEEALDASIPGKTLKVHRKTILQSEIEATKYWLTVYKETNLKFPLWRLYYQMEYDIYHYEFFYEIGKWPTTKEKNAKRVELRKKHKNINYE
jgi:hypothetical protein